MDIKELCKLCEKYSANKLTLKLEYDFKNRVGGKWGDTSKGMELINSKITRIERENKALEQKIGEVARVDFNWP